MEIIEKYSKKDLLIFKEIILKKLETAENDLKFYSGINQNNGTDDTSPSSKSFDESSNATSKEMNMQLATRQEKLIRDLKNALTRIENNTYGICRGTGKKIPKERLLLVPHANISIEAKKVS